MYLLNVYICRLEKKRLFLRKMAVNNIYNTHRFKAIDFFCGGGGMTCGLRQAGIDVIVRGNFDGYEYCCNYENTQHWNLDAEYLEPLKEFIVKWL